MGAVVSQKAKLQIQLMEEILFSTWDVKRLCKQWDKLPTSLNWWVDPGFLVAINIASIKPTKAAALRGPKWFGLVIMFFFAGPYFQQERPWLKAGTNQFGCCFFLKQLPCFKSCLTAFWMSYCIYELPCSVGDTLQEWEVWDVFFGRDYSPIRNLCIIKNCCQKLDSESQGQQGLWGNLFFKHELKVWDLNK